MCIRDRAIPGSRWRHLGAARLIRRRPAPAAAVFKVHRLIQHRAQGAHELPRREIALKKLPAGVEQLQAALRIAERHDGRSGGL
eukprot:4443655-Pyramimonas_sp.AAC.1